MVKLGRESIYPRRGAQVRGGPNCAFSFNMSSFGQQQQKDMNSLLANLNSVEPIDYGSSSNSHQTDDLGIFANTKFFDFDTERNTDVSVVDELLMSQEKQLQEKRARCEGLSPEDQHHQPQQQHMTEFSQLDFNSLGQFSLAEGLPNAQLPQQPHHQPHHQSTVAPQLPQQQHFIPQSASTPSTSSHQSPSEDTQDTKRRRTSRQSSTVPDTENRAAAEEDKRRRNTAASARFRIKKKQREQEMEKNAKMLQEKVQSLESKVSQLEMENKWLRNLVVEKNEARDVSSLLDMKNKVLADTKSSLEGIKSEKN